MGIKNGLREQCAVLLIACVIAFVSSFSLNGVEAPLHLSSKAVSVAFRAKAAQESGEGELQAIEDLEDVLRDPSFLRLDPQEKVQILFVLSKGYERFGRYLDQEKLLSTYASKRELYRFYIPLRVALVRSYVQQGRILEAEAVVKKLIKSSCAHLSLEEKSEIAAVLAFKDEYVFHLLKSGDRLMDGGNFTEALKKYNTVSSCIERQQFPYQSSVVERRQLRQKILLKVAEAHFSLGEYDAVVASLRDWDDRLFQATEDLPCIQRRLFLLGVSYKKLGREYAAEQILRSCSVCPKIQGDVFCEIEHGDIDWSSLLAHSSSLSKEYLLWLAYQAYSYGSLDGFQIVLAAIRTRSDFERGILRVLSGCEHLLMHETVAAVDDLYAGLLELGASESLWTQIGQNLLGELGWQRVVLLAFSQQTEKAQQLAEKIVSLVSPSSLRTGFFHLFLYEVGKTPSHATSLKKILKAHSNQAPSSTLSFLQASFEHKPEEAYESLRQDGQTADRLFCLWLYRETETVNKYFWEMNDLSISDQKSLLWDYSRALLAYQQAMCDEIGCERATTRLYQALSLSGLVDSHPQLLHCLVDLYLHSSQHMMAYEIVQELMETASDYPCLPALVLSCLVEFESCPELEQHKAALCRYLFDRTIDVHAFIAALHMFEFKKKVFDHAIPALAYFEKGLIAQEKARAHSFEAQQSKEPALIKDRLMDARLEYGIAREYLFQAMNEVPDTEAVCFLWGSLFNLHRELLEILSENLMTDSAFNELPTLIGEAVAALNEDLKTMPQKVENWQSFLQPTLLDTCRVMAKTSVLYSRIFQGEEDTVLAEVKQIIDSPVASPNTARVALFLGRMLRKANRVVEEEALLSLLHERQIKHANSELALEIAIEKSLCFWELKQTDKAMATLAWVINGPYASSLRVKAMILRAELYLSLHRLDLATRQLESVVSRGGEWAVIAERKLREIYGIS